MMFNRSEWAHRERLGLAPDDHHLVADAEPRALRAPRVLGSGPFAVAWRNYMKSIFKPGFMFKLSCRPSAVIYVAENKTLAGKEDRTYEGEATGRKLAFVFNEPMGRHPYVVHNNIVESFLRKKALYRTCH